MKTKISKGLAEETRVVVGVALLHALHGWVPGKRKAPIFLTSTASPAVPSAAAATSSDIGDPVVSRKKRNLSELMIKIYRQPVEIKRAMMRESGDP